MKFRSGNKIKYSQDFQQLVGVPSGIEFDVEIQYPNQAILKAPCYGGKPYGNGIIIIHRSMNKGIKWSRILEAAQHRVKPNANHAEIMARIETAVAAVGGVGLR